MPHDTSKDPRLLVAELAAKRLGAIPLTKLGFKPDLGKQDIAELLQHITSNLKTCRFMYLEPAALASQPQLREVADDATLLRESVHELFAKKVAPPLATAEIRWCFRTLEGLAGRLERGGESMASGVDLVAVGIKNVRKQGKLWVTRVDDGEREPVVVTNMPGITVGQVLGAAFLPPVDLAGMPSEAMFLGKEPRAEEAGSLLRDTDADVREAASILHEQVA